MADIVASTQRIIVNPASQKVKVLNTRFEGDLPEISEAPIDNDIYVRKNSGWVRPDVANLDDVDLTGVVGNDILRYNDVTSKWEPITLNTNALDDVDPTGLSNGDILNYNTTTSKWEPIAPDYVPLAGGGVITGSLTVEADIYVGKDGGSDSNLHFYDDNSNVWRTFKWDDSANDWTIEDNTSTHRKLWHAGNDGIGSGLDADTTDGLHIQSDTAIPSGSQLVRSRSNGYTYLGWINTVSGAHTSVPSRIYCSTDAFIRYMTLSEFRDKVADFTEFCNPQTRTLDSASTRTAGTIYDYTFATTVGGVAVSGAKAVIMNVTARAVGTGYMTVWGYDQTTPATSTINLSGTDTLSNQVTIPIDSSRRVKYEFNVSNGNLIIFDVVGFIF